MKIRGARPHPSCGRRAAWVFVLWAATAVSGWALNAPKLVSPASNAVLTDSSVLTLTWNAVPGAAFYRLYIGSTNDYNATNFFVQTNATSVTFNFGVPNGGYWWYVRAVDGANNVSPRSSRWIFTVNDTTPPPAPNLVSPPDNAIATNAVVTFRWNRAAGASLYALYVVGSGGDTNNIFGTQTTNHTVALTNGTYTWYVRAADWNNVGPVSVSRTLTVNDTNPPVAPTLVSPPDAATLTNSVSVALVWNSVAGAAGYRVYFNNTTSYWSTTTTNYIIGSVPNGGPYTWFVRAWDGVNVSPPSATWSFTMNDTTPPAPPGLVWPPNNAFLNSTTVELRWNRVWDAAGYYPHIVHHGGVTNWWNYSWTNGMFTLTNGSYQWFVRSYDGNSTSTNSAVRTFTVDTVSPAAPTLVSPADGAVFNTGTVTLVWNKVSDAVAYRVYRNNALVATVTTTNHTMTGLADGAYSWFVRAVDVANNVSVSSATQTFTVDTVPPAAPTLVSPANAAMLNSTSVTLVWNKVSDAVGYMVRWVQGGNTNMVSTAATNHVLTGLAESTYSWFVRAVDAANNVGAPSAVRTFTVDTTPPSPPALVSPPDNATLTNSVVAFRWNKVSDAASYRLYVVGSGGETNTQFNVATTNHSAGLTNGSYTWYVRALDAAGNVSVPSASRAFTLGDTVPPGIPTLVAPADGAMLNTSSVTLRWLKVADAASYRVHRVLAGVTNTVTVTATNAVLSGLADATYQWFVRAVDGANNVGAPSLVRTFTVDTVPPAAPTLVSPADGAVFNTRTVTLVWNKVSDAVAYRVYRNNALVATVTTTNHTMTGLADGAYSWFVRAVDAANNVSASSATRTFSVAVPTPAGQVSRTILKSDGDQLVYRHDAEKADAKVEILIYAATGRLVRRFPAGTGTLTVTWDGKDDDGRKCENGVYLIQVRENGRTVANRKIAVVK